ncbi:MAG: GNAT family N-acetyltransferase [Bacteroidales bacterium]|jgi:GNAT superfamily N-acetyltransferase|nr:GNAT family N-acetyltransferase [Bacteroidales bacterium]
MKITEVTAEAHSKEFIELSKRLYKGDPNWVCPLDGETESVFDRSRNAAFAHGEATRWILSDDHGKTIGRVAAFIDEIRSKANRQPTGGLGFFEVIESREAAFMLFDTARQWLTERGMKAMDGPINFGENDNYWGLLVEGFMQPGFGMPYNKPYYRQYFEEYGFRTYFEQYSYHKDVASVEVFPERFRKIAEWISKRPGYTFRHFEFSQSERFAADMVEIYNATWSVFKEDFTPLDPARIRNTLNQARAFIDPELVWFAYHNDKPVAFFIIFPDLNQIIRHFNGRLTPWNKIRFIYYKLTHEMTRVRALVAGVHPSYQNSGIESAIFLEIFRVFRRKRYIKELELSWVGDFNPKMISIYEAIGAHKAKTHLTLRYMIDDTLPFIMYKDEMDENRAAREAKLKN